VKFKTQGLKLKTKFRFLPDKVTADLAFEAFGRDYTELFENAGIALESSMVDIKTVNPTSTKKIKLKHNNLEDLLFSFLEELIFLKDAELFLVGRISCRIFNEGKIWSLEAILSGEKINKKKHKLGVDVKAVTKHLFAIKKFPDKTIRCRVVLDV